MFHLLVNRILCKNIWGNKNRFEELLAQATNYLHSVFSSNPTEIRIDHLVASFYALIFGLEEKPSICEFFWPSNVDGIVTALYCLFEAPHLPLFSNIDSVSMLNIRIYYTT